MGLFNKKGPEIVDYTLLEKKGFLKKKKERKLPYKINSGGFIELQSADNILKEEVIEKNNNLNEGQNPFSFLDNLAGASSSPSVPSTSLVNENNVGNFDGNENDFSSDINTLKVKIDDMEYKLERFVEKLNVIEEKISNFEKKT